MALPEIISASALLMGYPAAEEQTEIQPMVFEVEFNQEAVLPKVLKIVAPDIYWAEQ